MESLASLRRHRRALHRIPELDHALPKTLAYVNQALRDAQADEIRPCAGGVVAVYRARQAEKLSALGFRADMDALPICEQTGRPDASIHPGCMHACGHDGHMALALTLAQWLREHREELRRDVALLFQPAEETDGGALDMVREGALADPAIRQVYGIHLMPDLPLGTLGIQPGPLMASMTDIDVCVRGRSAHAAAPHTGADAGMALAQFLVSMQTALTRRVSPTEPIVFTAGHIEAGSVRNALAERARAECTLRLFAPELTQTALMWMRETLKGVDALYGTHSELCVQCDYPPVFNPEALTKRTRALAGEAGIPWTEVAPRMLAEDFSQYQLAAEGVFLFAGCGEQARPRTLHNAQFDFDERALLAPLSLYQKLITTA